MRGLPSLRTLDEDAAGVPAPRQAYTPKTNRLGTISAFR
jgi:hypothetical protein